MVLDPKVSTIKSLDFFSIFLTNGPQNGYSGSAVCVVLLGTRFLRVWPKKVFFHEFLWFWQFFHKFLLFFMILTVFSQISPIFHKFIACQLKFVKNGRNSWKTVKIMKNRRNLCVACHFEVLLVILKCCLWKKHLFRSNAEKS